MKLKYYNIEIDGIDKTGKDTLCQYLYRMSNKQYSIKVRGIISLIAYSKLFHRNVEYDLSSINKNTIYVVLTANEEDWKIRCKITNEQSIDFTKHVNAFNDALVQLSDKGFNVLVFDTSTMTPYQIAKEIISECNLLNKNAYEK